MFELNLHSSTLKYLYQTCWYFLSNIPCKDGRSGVCNDTYPWFSILLFFLIITYIFAHFYVWKVDALNTKTCPYLSIAFLINNNESLNYKENNLHKLSYLCLGLARDWAPVQVKPWRWQDHSRLNTIYISTSTYNCCMIHNNPLME